jgi:hypothetical protein
MLSVVFILVALLLFNGVVGDITLSSSGIDLQLDCATISGACRLWRPSVPGSSLTISLDFVEELDARSSTVFSTASLLNAAVTWSRPTWSIIDHQNLTTAHATYNFPFPWVGASLSINVILWPNGGIKDDGIQTYIVPPSSASMGFQLRRWPFIGANHVVHLALELSSNGGWGGVPKRIDITSDLDRIIDYGPGRVIMETSALIDGKPITGILSNLYLYDNEKGQRNRRGVAIRLPHFISADYDPIMTLIEVTPHELLTHGFIVMIAILAGACLCLLCWACIRLSVLVVLKSIFCQCCCDNENIGGSGNNSYDNPYYVPYDADNNRSVNNDVITPRSRSAVI